MKKCFKCGIGKPLSDYYKHPKTADGYLGKCKECNKKDSIKDYHKNIQNPEWQEKERDRTRERYHRLNYRETQKPSPQQRAKAMKVYKERYPEKYCAKSASQHLKKNNENNQLHHWSYNEEHYKDVIELTIHQHATAHRFMIYDQERKMYRTKDGILLDTKKAHYNYIKKFF